jgi:hypothetical protein
MYSALAAKMPPVTGDLYARRDVLSRLANMSRAQRRAAGVRAPLAQIQHELGGVLYAIGRMEDTAGRLGTDAPAPNDNKI